MAVSGQVHPSKFDGVYYIDNKLVEPSSKDYIPVFNPKDGSVITDKHVICRKEDVDRAVESSRRAFKGPWSKFSGYQRAQCLLRVAELMEKRADECSRYEVICTGRVLSRLTPQMPWVAKVFRYYAGWADKLDGDSMTDDDGFYKIVTREPLGVVAGIIPYNGPVVVFALKVAPALAAGNTIILKPPEKAPLSVMFLATLFEEAGFPEGVLNIITGDGATGALLASHMDIDKISFTGSVPVGRKIAAAAIASNMKRVSLELGGKSPALVFADAELENAIRWLTLGVTMNTGQVCISPSRVYVQESIADELIAGIRKNFEEIASELGGDTEDMNTTFGPLISDEHRERVEKYIEKGKTEATLITGGERHQGKGFYLSPAIFKNPGRNSSIIKEEIFGPVLCVTTFKTEEEAIELANDTNFGLAGYVFTENITRVLRVTKRLQAGNIGVNAVNVMPYNAPFGGYKESGVGKELGKYALDSYMNLKTIYIQTRLSNY